MKIDNEEITRRNKTSLAKLCEYKTSYRSSHRFLIGSWLLNDKELAHPFHKKSIIIIESINEIVDVDSISDIEIGLANSLNAVVNSYYFRLGLEDMIIYHDDHLYEVCDTIIFPKYSATLNNGQKKIQEENMKNFMSIKGDKGKGIKR
jgi:hypothetical protein